MSDSILYCDRCGRMIQAAELRTGQVIISPAMSICSNCTRQMSPEQKAAVQRAARKSATPVPSGRRPPAASGRRSTRRHTPLGTATTSTKRISGRIQAASAGGGGFRLVLALASAAAVALIIVAGALLLRTPAQKPTPRMSTIAPDAAPSLVVPVVQQATPATEEQASQADTGPADAAKRLAELREMIDPSLGRYGDIREGVKALAAEFEGQAAAEEATKLMAEVDAAHAKLADEAYWAATERAYALVSRSKFDEAASAVRSVLSRFGESPWSAQRGQARVDAILKRIEGRRSEIGDESIARAEKAVEAEKFAVARQRLGGRDGWPAAQQAKAEGLLKRIGELEAAYLAKRKRETTWANFVAALKEAGAKGVAEAQAYAESERGKLRELGLDDKLARFERRFRDAKMIGSLIEDGLRSARGMVRLKHGDRPVAGQILKIERGVATLKPSVGDQFDVPLSEVPPQDLVQASDLLRIGAVQPLRVAGYYFVRGDMEGATSLLADLVGENADALRKDLELYAAALRSISEGAGEETAAAADAEEERLQAVELSESFSDSRKAGEHWSLGAGWEIKDGALAKVSGGESMVTTNAPVGTRVSVEVTVKVSKGEAAKWKVAGPAIWADEHNFWALLLGETPEGKRYVELKESLDGKWGAEGVDATKLTLVKNGSLEWEYDRAYRMRIEITPEGVAGVVTEVGGTGKAELQYAFDRKAVTSGKPGLRSYGFAAFYDDFASTVRTTAALVEAAVREPELPRGPDTPLPGETGKPGQWGPGLIAEYFVGKDLSNRVGVRIDRMGLNHLYGNGSFPSLKTVKPPFKVRWTGLLLLPFDGAYFFEATVNGRFEMEMDGVPVVQAKGTARSDEVRCRAGLHRIKAVYHGDESWWREVILSWVPPEMPKETIPASHYFHEVPELGSMGPPAEFVEGLWTEVFADAEFQRKVWEGPIAAPEFNFGHAAPVPNCPNDTFSIRLTGYFVSIYNKEYVVKAETSDSVRVKVDGATVIDYWKVADKTALKVRKKFDPGLRKLVVEYMDEVGSADLGVWWHPREWGGDRKYERTSPCFCKAPELRLVDRRGIAPGLTGTLYPSENPTQTRGAVRTYETEIVHSWATIAPGPNIPRDKFSAVWQGVLVVPESGLYRFHIQRTGGIRLTVGNQHVINSLSPSKNPEWAEVPLRAGKTPVMIRYLTKERRSELKAYWSGPKFLQQPLGAEALAHASPRLPIAKTPPIISKAPVARPAAGPAAGPAGGPAAGAAGGAEEAEVPPEGNLVGNGGFEVAAEGERLADRWKAHEWSGNARYSVRIDKSNPHAGERAVVTRGLTEGALPGVFTAVRMPVGKYELRFWAAADIGEKARIHAHLAGEDLAPAVVGEEWRQLKFNVTVKEKQVNAPLRLWTSTPKVRVWFDDVEVESIR